MLKGIKRFFLVFFLIMFFAMGFYLAYDLFGRDIFNPVISASSGDETVDKKLFLEEAIVESFESKKELITLEAELTDIVEWDDSWGTLNLFRKSQRMKFYGTGLYITDLNLMSSGDIQINMDNFVITVALPRPIIKSVTIDEDRTEYEDVDNGWLRFGSISLKPEQYNAIYASVKDNMQKLLESYDYYSEAERSTVEQVTEILQFIIDSFSSDIAEESFTIRITWKS